MKGIEIRYCINFTISYFFISIPLLMIYGKSDIYRALIMVDTNKLALLSTRLKKTVDL
jgi:hypothetical protein